jgi:hypothetical protein
MSSEAKHSTSEALRRFIQAIESVRAKERRR